MHRTLFAAAILAGFAAPAAAQENLIHEIRGGILAHDRAIFARDPVENGADINGELAFRSLSRLFGGAIRPVAGASIAPGGRTSIGYGDLRWEYSGAAFFFGIGLGAAVHDGELERGVAGRRGLGSRVLFHIPAEIGYQFTAQDRVSIYFEHVSNATLADPNPGMDNIGVRLAHQF